MILINQLTSSKGLIANGLDDISIAPQLKQQHIASTRSISSRIVVVVLTSTHNRKRHTNDNDNTSDDGGDHKQREHIHTSDSDGIRLYTVDATQPIDDLDERDDHIDDSGGAEPDQSVRLVSAAYHYGLVAAHGA